MGDCSATGGGGPGDAAQRPDLQEYIAQKRRAVEEFLRRVLPPPETLPAKLHEAVRYAALAGGKRLRPTLALAVCETLGGPADACLPVAAAVELIHASSLIHDDLPCMDDADMRHGKPACHKVFGEALAVLAGDWLLIFPFVLISTPALSPGLDDAVRLALVRELSHAVGSEGIIGGQVLDIDSHAARYDGPALEALHRRKTGRLIVAAARCGALVARAPENTLAAITRFATHLGLAYQIADDVLDATGREETLGKPVGSDAALEKATYVTVYGLERARELAREQAQLAHHALREAPACADASLLHALIDFCVTRSY